MDKLPDLAYLFERETLAYHLAQAGPCLTTMLRKDWELMVAKNPVFIAGGDFDKDVQRNLAVTNSGSDDVSILLGNSGGGFAAAIAISDLNNDSKGDLAVANFGSE